MFCRVPFFQQGDSVVTIPSNSPSRLIMEVFRAISPSVAVRKQQVERSEGMPGYPQAQYLSAGLEE